MRCYVERLEFVCFSSTINSCSTQAAPDEELQSTFFLWMAAAIASKARCAKISGLAACRSDAQTKPWLRVSWPDPSSEIQPAPLGQSSRPPHSQSTHPLERQLTTVPPSSGFRARSNNHPRPLNTCPRGLQPTTPFRPNFQPLNTTCINHVRLSTAGSGRHHCAASLEAGTLDDCAV